MTPREAAEQIIGDPHPELFEHSASWQVAMTEHAKQITAVEAIIQQAVDAALARYSDPTPLDEAWLRERGFTFVDDPVEWASLFIENGSMYPFYIAIRKNGELHVGGTKTAVRHPTRGQLEHLLAALGIAEEK